MSTLIQRVIVDLIIPHPNFVVQFFFACIIIFLKHKKKMMVWFPVLHVKSLEVATES